MDEWYKYMDIDKINILIDDIYNSNKLIFPLKENVLNAFTHFTPNELKVVILGQDCYINYIISHNIIIPQANGLSFSVNKEHKIPPSLKNIFKEMEHSINNFKIPKNGDLTYLAKQGILLLNCSLTVENGKSNSHIKLWTDITDNIIKNISNNLNNIVFVLWGNYAKSKIKFINNNKHYIITGVHPSPLSAKPNMKGHISSFFGHDYFNKINDYLIKNNKLPICWNKN